MFFGWGTRIKKWVVPFENEKRTLVLKYHYFSLFFIFATSYNYQWLILSDKRSEDRVLTEDEVKKIFFPGQPPLPGFWERYGLALFVGFIVLFFLFPALRG